MMDRPNNTYDDAVALARALVSDDEFGDRFNLTVKTDYLDGERRLSLHLRDGEAPWVQAAVWIYMMQDERLELFSAFGIDALPVAMREDFAPQQHAVEVMEQVLGKCIRQSSEFLVRSLRADWKMTENRLERCWEEIARGEEKGPVAFCIRQAHQRNSLALVARTTGMSCDECFRVEWSDEKNAYVKAIAVGTFVAPTPSSLSGMAHLSGHAQLEILSQKPGVELARARAAFDHERKREAGQRSVKPVRANGIALIEETGDKRRALVAFPDGRSARLTQSSLLYNISISPANKHGVSAALELSCGQNRPIFIRRGFSGSHPFDSTDRLDEIMRILLTVIIENDEPLSDRYLPPDADAFDSMHPLLADIAVRPRHRAFIGSILGSPYRRARERAERFSKVKAGKRAREAMKAEDDRLLEEAQALAIAKSTAK